MSEKRFSYGRKNDLNFGYCPHCIRDLQEDKIFTDYTEIADLLNKQSDEIGNLKGENEQLKLELSECTNNKLYSRRELEEENEKLKIANARWLDKSLQDKQIRYSNANCKELTKKYLQLKEENEQLKNYFKKRAQCSNFQINKLKEEIAELQEDNVDTIVELSKENEQLRTQLLICQQSKSDDGRFQVWEVPPIPQGKRISFTTNDDDGDGNGRIFN